LKESPYQTHFTRQVNYLLAKVAKKSAVKDSLVDLAIDYFEQDELHASEQTQENEPSLRLMQRTERYSNLLSIALNIIELAEGGSFVENNRKSAQFLGTVQLLSPTEGTRVAQVNEQSKSVYKAVLCLRLLDQLIISGKMNDPYVNTYLNEVTPEQYLNFIAHDTEVYTRFIAQVKVPLVMAALLQDIGNYHPKAQTILLGANGKLNPFRTLDVKQRKLLLQINYTKTQKFLVEGIGMPTFVGNTKAAREQFLIDEQGKLSFMQNLLKTSVNPKKSLGNVLKVPQIYTSIILSTKDSYNYKLLPQVYQVLNKNAELGACSQVFVDALHRITGMFPQGFGIVYMPSGEFGEQSDCYEYAIVNALYPKKTDEPNCRMTTRRLTFIGHGQNNIIKTNSNLYFTATAKKLARLSKERLNEILAVISSNSEERQQLDLLPRCWHGNEFFSVKANQNLWNKSEI
jgi:hypothetical protein